SFLVQTLVHLGETDRAEQVLAGLGDQDRDLGVMRISLATLRLAQHNAREATAALAPVLDGSAPVPWQGRLAQAFLLEAVARPARRARPAPGRARRPAPARPDPRGAPPRPCPPPPRALPNPPPRLGPPLAPLSADISGLRAGRNPAPPAGPRPPLGALSDSEV